MGCRPTPRCGQEVGGGHRCIPDATETSRLPVDAKSAVAKAAVLRHGTEWRLERMAQPDAGLRDWSGSQCGGELRGPSTSQSRQGGRLHTNCESPLLLVNIVGRRGADSHLCYS